jgi:large repetitive protein
MRRAVAVLGLALASITVVAAAGQQDVPARARPVDPDRGTASIRGRVTAADTGAPVRRAQIRAGAPGVPLARFVTTDEEGRFELLEVPPGKWTLTASRAGYVSRRLGQRRDFQVVEPLDVADGQRIVNADFVLPRGAAITGHVQDEFGEPLAAITVQVLRSQVLEGRRRLTPIQVTDQTDDTGAFRLYGLAPGDYYVAASLRIPGMDLGPTSVYAPTYFPGTGNISEAQRVTVASGQEQANVNFALLPVRTVRVSGSVVSSSGEMAGNGMIMLTSPGGADDPGVRPANVLPDGTFNLLDVAPGTYLLTVNVGAGRANPEPEVAAVPITVGLGDLTGLTVTTGPGTTVSGRVTTDRAGTPPPNGVSVVLRDIDSPGLSFRGARVNPSGTFLFAALVGPYAFGLDGVPEGWAVKSVLLGGTDVTDRAIEFAGTERLDAQIILTRDVTELSGQAKLRGERSTDYAVIVFPDDDSKWAYPSRFVRTARADAQGRFSIRGLPPNASYRALALDYIEEGESSDPEFLARMKDRAESFSLREAETKSLDLTVLER